MAKNKRKVVDPESAMEEMVTLVFLTNCPTINQMKGSAIDMTVANYEAEIKKGEHKTTGKPKSVYVNHTKVIDGPDKYLKDD